MAEIQFTGNVGADAELRHTRDGMPVLNVRVCDSKSRRDAQGNWETLAETWYQVSLFGAAAQALAPEIVKGTRVRVAGEFYTREYEGRNGTGVSNDVTATGIRVLPRRNQDGNGQRGQQSGGWGGQAAPQDAWSGGGWEAPAGGEPPF